MIFLKQKAGHTIFPLIALLQCFTTHGQCSSLVYVCFMICLSLLFWLYCLPVSPPHTASGLATPTNHHFKNKPPPIRPPSSSGTRKALSPLASFYSAFTIQLRSHLVYSDLPNSSRSFLFCVHLAVCFHLHTVPSKGLFPDLIPPIDLELLKIETKGSIFM